MTVVDSRFASRWAIATTALGCLFAIQLRFYYGLTWSRSLFWGLTDWYLWGTIALGIIQGVRLLCRANKSTRSKYILYAIAAPFVAGFHVSLTLVISGVSDLPTGLKLLDLFWAMYTKKLVINFLTFSAIVASAEWYLKPKDRRQQPLVARLGDTTRVVSADEIIWGEVSGNYVNLHTNSGVWPVRETLDRLIRRLPKRQFLQVSRSILVNIERVQATRSRSGVLYLVLPDKMEIRVARRRTSAARKLLQPQSNPLA